MVGIFFSKLFLKDNKLLLLLHILIVAVNNGKFEATFNERSDG